MTLKSSYTYIKTAKISILRQEHPCIGTHISPLGSNQGQRAELLTRAVAEIHQRVGKVAGKSSVYESPRGVKQISCRFQPGG